MGEPFGSMDEYRGLRSTLEKEITNAKKGEWDSTGRFISARPLITL